MTPRSRPLCRLPGTISALLVLLLLISCAPIRPPSVAASPEQWARQARQLAASGQTLQAAARYRHAARLAAGSQRHHYLLRAAQALYQGGKTEDAYRLLAGVDANQLPASDQIDLALLHSRLALDRGDPDTGLTTLARLDPEQLTDFQRTHYHQLRAAAFSLTGDLVASIRERLQLEPLLRQPQALDDNHQAILEALQLLTPEQIDQLAGGASEDLAGWLELAAILKQHSVLSPELERELYRWRLRYPSHPAERGHFLQRHLAQRQPALTAPHQIAVMLPESGPYQSAGQAIKTGLLTARQLPYSAYQPLLEFFDSESDGIWELYQQAAQAGAELIIGPLQKNKLEQLAQGGHLNPPVLALNSVDALQKEGLYQFALSPEGEVEQVANSAWTHNLQRALVLVPDNDFGNRIAVYFANYWQALGGTVLETQYYDPDATHYAEALEPLLNVDESRQRFQRLQRVIGPAKFETRIRRDADFLLLLASPEQGRVIRPQLLFYKADYLPVYATSMIYSGHVNPRWDQDLEGVRFCDIPWLLNGEFTNAPTLETFVAEHGKLPGPLLRLVALGIDAYHLPNTLLTNGQRYGGTTGVLTLRGHGRIGRQLTCAEFKNGAPVIYGLAPEVAMDVPGQ